MSHLRLFLVNVEWHLQMGPLLAVEKERLPWIVLCNLVCLVLQSFLLSQTVYTFRSWISNSTVVTYSEGAIGWFWVLLLWGIGRNSILARTSVPLITDHKWSHLPLQQGFFRTGLLLWLLFLWLVLKVIASKLERSIGYTLWITYILEVLIMHILFMFISSR